MSKHRRVSSRGLQFIAAFEGIRLYAYNDPAGHATCGVGHLLHEGPVNSSDRAKFGTEKHPKMTRAQALALFRADLARFEEAVRQAPMPGLRRQRKFDALVSITFNVGTAILGPDRSLGQALRSGRNRRVADAILLYDKAGGRALPGLTRRRRAERRLYLTGNYDTR